MADEDFKKCPYELKVDIDKPLYIVALFPLINELQRTMNAAFADSELDFKYFKDHADNQYKTVIDSAEKYADSIK